METVFQNNSIVRTSSKDIVTLFSHTYRLTGIFKIYVKSGISTYIYEGTLVKLEHEGNLHLKLTKRVFSVIARGVMETVKVKGKKQIVKLCTARIDTIKLVGSIR